MRQMGPVPPVPGIDTSKPNTARVYDYLLGGKDNFAADREQAEKILQIDPRAAEMCKENREFVTRAVSWAVCQGISQFLDLGAGLPTSPSVHEAARLVIPEASVCYVDHDPVAVLHANALLTTPDGVTATEADLADPDKVLADTAVMRTIDLTRPVCVILAAVLHFYDPLKAQEITTGYLSRLAPGSMMAISCLRIDDPAIAEKRAAYTPARLYNHSSDEFLAFFAGQELIGPGLAHARAWRGGMSQVPANPPGALYNQVGMGVKGVTAP